MVESPNSTDKTVKPASLWFGLTASVLLIGTAIAGGVTSYRNWRRLSQVSSLEKAEGQGRQEFMALLGVFISATLGMGLMWLTLPLFIINLCVSSR